jgi:murein DD-endopeptidase MepM/ murein hydrolase activator NlpD
MQLRSPLHSAFPITQRFAENPDAYKRYGILGHNGIDYGTPTGTPILAVDAGTVLEVWEDTAGYGRYVKVGHDWGESLYAHLEQQTVTVGATVGQGQPIGISGNTGNSTGPHLHFGMRIKPYFRDNGWGGYVDPYPVSARAAGRHHHRTAYHRRGRPPSGPTRTMATPADSGA